MVPLCAAGPRTVGLDHIRIHQKKGGAPSGVQFSSESATLRRQRQRCLRSHLSTFSGGGKSLACAQTRDASRHQKLMILSAKPETEQARTLARLTA